MGKGMSSCFSAPEEFFYIYFITIAGVLILIRVLYVVYRSSKPLGTTSSQPLSTLIVLGSGGHTAEMLNLLSVLHLDRFSPRVYIAAATDNMSLQKARLFENSLIDKVDFITMVMWPFGFLCDTSRIPSSLSKLLKYPTQYRLAMSGEVVQAHILIWRLQSNNVRQALHSLAQGEMKKQFVTHGLQWTMVFLWHKLRKNKFSEILALVSC